MDFKDMLAPGGAALAYLGSIETRLRTKIGRKECRRVHNGLDKKIDRIESHLWDLLCAQNIKPSVDPPEEIKNNHAEKKVSG